jgi:hypothetical protein
MGSVARRPGRFSMTAMRSSFMSRFAADDPAHRRIMAQALGVVHVLVSARTSLAITVKPIGIIEFAIGKQPSIGGHHGAAKLEHQAAVKIKPKSIRFRFTRCVRHRRLAQSTISC